MSNRVKEVPPAVIPLLSLMDDYQELARTSPSVVAYNIYTMVIKDLQQILREIKEK